MKGLISISSAIILLQKMFVNKVCPPHGNFTHWSSKGGEMKDLFFAKVISCKVVFITQNDLPVLAVKYQTSLLDRLIKNRP